MGSVVWFWYGFGMFVVWCGKVILLLWFSSGMFVVYCGMVIVFLWCVCGMVVVCGCFMEWTEVVGLATSKPLFANMLHRFFVTL